MRNISFALTTQQIRDRTKTVTRRLGWEFLKRGDMLMACEKCQGVKKGELVRLGPIRVVSVTREPLDGIRLRPDDTQAEGFPDLSPGEFVTMFCEHMGCQPDTMVTRIEFEYAD